MFKLWNTKRKLCIEIVKIVAALVFAIFFFSFLYVIHQNSEAFREDCESKGFRVVKMYSGAPYCVDPKMIKDKM